LQARGADDVSFLTAAFSILSAAVWGYYGWSINATVGFILIVGLKLRIPSKAANGWRWI
jgi:hypothetical protein